MRNIKPEIERHWKTAAGLDALCLWVNASHRCGYVRVSEKHPWYEKYYSDFDNYESSPEDLMEVHGGLTFSGIFLDLEPAIKPSWWFGFDCAHLGDATAYRNSPGDILRDQPYVEAECEKLAVQLRAITGKLPA